MLNKPIMLFTYDLCQLFLPQLDFPFLEGLSLLPITMTVAIFLFLLTSRIQESTASKIFIMLTYYTEGLKMKLQSKKGKYKTEYLW